MERLPLNRILDILEENDFIEMFDELGEERCYRFNHTFLNSTLSQMMPFQAFKWRIHAALAEYYRNTRPE